MGTEKVVSLSKATRKYLEASLAPNTRRAYGSDLRHFLEWGGSIPASAATVAEYLSQHAEALSPATLERRLSAIAKAHAAKGCSDPARTELVRATMRGIRRLHGGGRKAARPLLRADLVSVLARMGKRLKDRRDRALLLVGFAGGFRASELCAINCMDIEWVGQGMIVHLRRSKTDLVGLGRKVAIPYGRKRTCPVRALRGWLDRSGIDRGPVFRRIDRHGNVLADRISGEAVSLVVKLRVADAGLDAEGYSSHSLRAGFATSAAMAGINTLAIRRQTGHRSDAMLARYVRDSDLFAASELAGLL